MQINIDEDSSLCECRCNLVLLSIIGLFYFLLLFFSLSISSISVLTMRLLQDSSRPLCFWSPRQSWSSRRFSPSGISLQVFLDIVHADLPFPPSASLEIPIL